MANVAAFISVCKTAVAQVLGIDASVQKLQMAKILFSRCSPEEVGNLLDGGSLPTWCDQVYLKDLLADVIATDSVKELKIKRITKKAHELFKKENTKDI